jgi:hypothetical protein
LEPESVGSQRAAATGDACDFDLQCLDFNFCTKDECIDKKCASSPQNEGGTCNDGNACTDGTTCQSGVCKGGTVEVCVDPDPNDCKTVQCRGMGTGCDTVNRTSGACSDGNACTSGETCSQGNCQGAVAYSCPDADPNDCVVPTCDGSGGCPDATVANTTSCVDADACTKDTTCTDGMCGGGTTHLCPDGAPDDCWVPTCDGSGGCMDVKRNVSDPCDDGLSCTAGTVCDASATCVGGSVTSCADANVDDCLVPTCDGKGGCADLRRAAGEVCTDSDPCTVDTLCQGSGACAGGSTTVCLDQDAQDCLVPTCNGVGGCADAKLPTGTPCVDPDACTVGTTCGAAGACGGGTRSSCIDANPNDCLVPACDGAGGCVEQKGTVDEVCGDGDPCTAGTRCDAAGACRGGTTTTCTDSTPDDCFVTVCDGQGGCAVAAAAPSSVCSDKNPCTAGEACNASGQCVGGNTVSCDDGDPCTVDSCRFDLGCLHAPAGCPSDGGGSDAALVDAAVGDATGNVGDASGMSDATVGDASLVDDAVGMTTDAPPDAQGGDARPDSAPNAASDASEVTVEEDIQVLGGGCRCDVAPPSRHRATGTWLGGVMLVLGAVLWRTRRRHATVLVLVVSALSWGQAHARPLGKGRLDLNLQRAGAGQGSYLVADGALVLERGQFAGALLVDYLRDALVVQKGEQELPIVENRVLFHLAAAVGVWEPLQVGLALPVVAAQSGTVAPLDQGTLEGSTWGDLLVEGKLRLFGEPAMACALGLLVPTGTEDGFASSGAWGVRPRFLVETRTRSYAVAGEVGLILRSESSRFGDLEVQHEVELRAAARLRLASRLDAVVETNLVSDAQTFAPSRTPLEAMAGLRFAAAEDTAVVLGVGAGITSGYGAPAVHALLGLRYVADGLTGASGTARPR